MTIPQDGRMTSFDPLTGTLTGTELMWIVSPGNAANGVLYNTTLDFLAPFFAAFPALNTTIITSGATLASPYDLATSDTRVLFKKTLGTASYMVCPLAADMDYAQTVLIKDAKGDADVNPITITFTGGELCDGLDTLTINTSYGWLYITPTPGGGSWYMS